MHDIGALLGLQSVMLTDFDETLDDEIEGVHVVVVQHEIADPDFFGLVVN
jgi:hypothetical protein